MPDAWTVYALRDGELLFERDGKTDSGGPAGLGDAQRNPATKGNASGSWTSSKAVDVGMASDGAPG